MGRTVPVGGPDGQSANTALPAVSSPARATASHFRLGRARTSLPAMSSMAASMTAAPLSMVAMRMSWPGQSTNDTCLVARRRGYRLVAQRNHQPTAPPRHCARRFVPRTASASCGRRTARRAGCPPCSSRTSGSTLAGGSSGSSIGRASAHTQPPDSPGRRGQHAAPSAWCTAPGGGRTLALA